MHTNLPTELHISPCVVVYIHKIIRIILKTQFSFVGEKLRPLQRVRNRCVVAAIYICVHTYIRTCIHMRIYMHHTLNTNTIEFN